MSVKATAEKNFRRARIRPTGRQKWARGWITWRAGRWIVAVLVIAYGGYRATALVLSLSPSSTG